MRGQVVNLAATSVTTSVTTTESEKEFLENGDFMARILVVGKGGYGDMFPMFAIAKMLKDKGHFVSIAAEGHHEDAAIQINIPLVKLDPDNIAGTVTTNSSVFSKLRGVAEIIQTLSPQHLDVEYEVLLAIAGNYDLIVGNQLAYSGSIVCKKTGQPWVFCAPSPLAFPSYNDPPLFPYIHSLQNLSMTYPRTQRPYIALARGVSRMMMYSVIRQQRRFGIKNVGHPRFEGMYSEHLNLLMTSPVLVSPQPDWPKNTVLTGFSWFEPDFMRGEEKLLRLSQFIESGPPPVIFAPGGGKRTQPGQFFAESIKACKMLGVRGVLLAAQRFHAELPQSPDILVTGYLPYSDLLKNASAIVHSGGIGAIGWGLRFGMPSLLVPSSWDQFDNSHRARQHNFALVMSQGDYKAPAIAENLDKLFENHAQHQLLQSHTRSLADEDGASVACAHIESVLREVA
jgi:UDP:flavonoid glycosyltransferase YjiC (YdhE family)